MGGVGVGIVEDGGGSDSQYQAKAPAFIVSADLWYRSPLPRRTMLTGIRTGANANTEVTWEGFCGADTVISLSVPAT